MSDHANIAATATAGYSKTNTDMGASFKGARFRTVLEKQVTGEPGASGHLIRAYGESSVDQPTAEANALLALNAQRNLTYGTGATGNKGGYGGSLTHDVT